MYTNWRFMLFTWLMVSAVCLYVEYDNGMEDITGCIGAIIIFGIVIILMPVGFALVKLPFLVAWLLLYTIFIDRGALKRWWAMNGSWQDLLPLGEPFGGLHLFGIPSEEEYEAFLRHEDYIKNRQAIKDGLSNDKTGAALRHKLRRREGGREE
ncbi:MAG: hypothetical protein Q4D21_08985 [Phascolarctobacterium sp.]|nr:hypothetical protein [Phascolarctobacterium sp.]